MPLVYMRLNIYHVNGRAVRNAAFGEVLLEAPMAGGDFGRSGALACCWFSVVMSWDEPYPQHTGYGARVQLGRPQRVFGK